MTKNYYISGDHNVTCDVCSKKIKMSEAKLRWDGFLVCKDDYEMRHPQDFVRARQDKISVSNTRPIPPFIFTDIDYIDTNNSTCTPSGSQSIPMEGIPGCMIPNKILSGL